jgi:hypothetical protein
MANTENYLYPIHVRQGRSPNKYQAGFINADGKTIISPDYDDARPFSEGLALVQLGGKWGAIDASGRISVPYTHSGMGLRFSEGRVGFASAPFVASTWGQNVSIMSAA